MSSISIEYKGVEFEVSYDYEPGEPEVRYYSNGDPGHPGSPESCEITGVEYAGEDWYDLLSHKAFEELEQAIWDHRAYHDDYCEDLRFEERRGN